MPDFATKDPSNLMLGNADGTFTESGRGGRPSCPSTRGRGAAVVDLNLDGMLELVEVNRRADVSIYRAMLAGATPTAGADGRLGVGST